MTPPRRRAALLLLVPFVAAACAEPPTSPDLDLPVAMAKGGKGGGGGAGDPAGGGPPAYASATVVDASDHWTGGANHGLATSACLGTPVGTDALSVQFQEPSDCTVTLAGATLADDLALHMKSRKGTVMEVLFVGQDVTGDAGTMHESEAVVPADGVRGGDGVLHVHAADVPVWRLSGHLRGKPVAMVGTVSIGDVIYGN